MPSPKELLERYGLHAKKSWGQCFLHDPSVIVRIADAAQLSSTDTVVEIGAGLGALTLELAKRARRVLAIERDRDMVHVLEEELAGLTNVEIVAANALTFDLLALGVPLIVVGNLPYHLASQLLFHVLAQRPAVRRAVFMVQREVADRLIAAPGSRSYGVPSVLAQQEAELHFCFAVSREAFVPRPRVESAVIRLELRASPRVAVEPELFRALVRAAFSARRKTLRRALALHYPAALVEESLARAGLDGTRRAETLSVEEFGQLAQAAAAVLAPSTP